MGTESQLVRPRQAAMPTADRSGASPSPRTAAGAIMFAAVLLRIVAALYQGNTVVDMPGIYDQLSYRPGAAGRGGTRLQLCRRSLARPPVAASRRRTGAISRFTWRGFTAFSACNRCWRDWCRRSSPGCCTWLAYRIGRRVFGPTTELLRPPSAPSTSTLSTTPAACSRRPSTS
ncbi:MAG: hypothetical protein R2851_28285 [Caldilineaceae bacterium]